jgi:hypothetical protein
MHKPFDPSSSAHKNFVKKIILDMEAIESKNLGINFNREKEVISNY